jgi:hypothetical protein
MDNNNNYAMDIQKAPFLFLQNHPSDFNTPMKKVLGRGKTTGCDEQIMKNTFFSQMNIDYINNMIMKTVYNNSCEKYIIRKQKSAHLFQVMESIWEDHAQHMLTGQKEQIRILDKLVIDFCVDTIIEEIKTRTLYLRDKFAPPVTLPDPINDSTAGTKSYAPSLSVTYDDFDIYSRKGETDNIYNRKVVNDEDAVIHEDYQMNYKHKM